MRNLDKRSQQLVNMHYLFRDLNLDAFFIIMPFREERWSVVSCANLSFTP